MNNQKFICLKCKDKRVIMLCDPQDAFGVIVDCDCKEESAEDNMSMIQNQAMK